MAKRELSSTLKNLKFMQRAAQREVIVKKEEVKEDAAADLHSFPSSIAAKRCVVIVEGDPHPAATRGRISFLNFNPAIDKLGEEPSDLRQNDSGATTPVRENGSSRDRSDSSDMDSFSCDGSSELKRKHTEISNPESLHPNKSPENSQRPSPSSSKKSLQKPNKREKLDWNVLRPPKYPRKKQ